VYWQLKKRRKRLKMKLEMAKFLQDTIEETALQRKDASGEGETVQEFVKFMDKVHISECHLVYHHNMEQQQLFYDLFSRSASVSRHQEKTGHFWVFSGLWLVTGTLPLLLHTV